tara:strand:- start:904 stop:1098 length:195 start_codon:yes stop_codon:yes gene_type:complete
LGLDTIHAVHHPTVLARSRQGTVRGDVVWDETQHDDQTEAGARDAREARIAARQWTPRVTKNMS